MKYVSEKKSRGHRTSKIVKSNQTYSNGHTVQIAPYSNTRGPFLEAPGNHRARCFPFQKGVSTLLKIIQ